MIQVRIEPPLDSIVVEAAKNNQRSTVKEVRFALLQFYAIKKTKRAKRGSASKSQSQ